jgi:hypothetical protein
MIWWFGTESNRRHEDFQSSALPTELPNRIRYSCFFGGKLAELTGLEPATSGVTDRRELQLHHSSIFLFMKDRRFVVVPSKPDTQVLRLFVDKSSTD